MMERLQFRPVDIEQHANICISFREDSFVVSFGNTEKFYEEDGKGAERYIDWLRSKITIDPRTVIHIWYEKEIIGQMELGRLREVPSTGYVNLFYLIEKYRGQGLGIQLDDYAVTYFRELGLRRIRLSVSPTNLQALTYYKKMGWKDLGPSLKHPEVHLMEKNI